MDVLNKFRFTVTNTMSQLSTVLPGNPVTREYEATKHIASAGIGVYSYSVVFFPLIGKVTISNNNFRHLKCLMNNLYIYILGLLWKIYSGYKKSTNQPASIFLLEKRQLDKWSKTEREHIIEVIKKGVAQLSRLKHPQVLTVQHTLEESRLLR